MCIFWGNRCFLLQCKELRDLSKQNFLGCCASDLVCIKRRCFCYQINGSRLLADEVNGKPLKSFLVVL